MKKSEALEIIRNVFKDPSLQGMTYNFAVNSVLPVLILEKLEEAGMSPPWYHCKKQPYTDPEDEFGQWSSYNEFQDWEPENDY